METSAHISYLRYFSLEKETEISCQVKSAMKSQIEDHIISTLPPPCSSCVFYNTLCVCVMCNCKRETHYTQIIKELNKIF